MKNRQEFLQHLKESLEVEDFLTDILGINDIKISGDELIFSCPLPFGGHSNRDISPSSGLNTESLLFNCFSENMGGDIIWLVQQVNDVTLQEALEILEQNASNSNLSFQTFEQKLYKAFTSSQLSSKDWIEYDSIIIEPWMQYCPYLTNRGVSAAVQTEMLTGVVRRQEESIYATRIVIPHFFTKKLIGWTMRIVPGTYDENKHKNVPKYLHSTSFPKKNTLYNYDNVNKDEPLIVVESPMSVLVLKSRGVPNAVATFGASVSEDQISLLRDFPHIQIFPDGDKAGMTSANTLINGLDRFIEVEVVIPPVNADAADIVDPKEYIEKNKVDSYLFNMEKAFLSQEETKKSVSKPAKAR